MHNVGSQGRIRWAAIGAAVAVTLGAGGIGVVRATVTSGERPVFISITPCRLVDTRPAPTTVGTRATPLQPAETATFTVHGTNGNCTIPAGALAIDANVTITAPTSDGFLSVFPADAALPNASSLNWSAGQAPTPNAVTVDLSTDGKVNVFNERGTVNVIIDIVGYYEDHNHDDRYLQLGPIVMSHPGLNYRSTEGPPTTFEQFITWTNTSGDGRVNLHARRPDVDHRPGLPPDVGDLLHPQRERRWHRDAGPGLERDRPVRNCVRHRQHGSRRRRLLQRCGPGSAGRHADVAAQPRGSPAARQPGSDCRRSRARGARSASAA